MLSSHAIYLIGIFHGYFDNENRVKFISSLSQLPSNMLVAAGSVSGDQTVPSAFLQTLLMLLEGESLSEVNVSHSSPGFVRDLEFKTEEPLSVTHFKQLIKMSEDVDCSQLDSTILKLLRKSLLYVLASTTTLLNACLDHPTQSKIAVAAHLVVHSPALRLHFELRCLSRSSPKKMRASAKTSPVDFKDHLKEFLPLVSSYLFCVHGMKGDTSGKL